MDFLKDITITEKEALSLGIIGDLGFVSSEKTAFKKVNAEILEQLKQGNLIFRKPWRDGYKVKGVVYGAHNYVTTHTYQGANAFMIEASNMINQTAYKQFLTLKQIRERGGKLNKEATAFPVWAFIKTEKTELNKKTDKLETTISKGVIGYVVFPIEHTTNVKPIKHKELKTSENEVNLDAETLIKYMPKLPPIKHGGDRAYYTPSSDYVQMPFQKAFKSTNDYYSTLFHELSHSTGHPKRVGRDLTGRKGNAKYALEELIAELSAAYLCSVCDMPYYTLNNTTAYLKGWSDVLYNEIKTNPQFLLRAVYGATKSAKYIIGTTLEKHGVVSTEVKKEKTKKAKTNSTKPKTETKKSTSKTAKPEVKKVKPTPTTPKTTTATTTTNTPNFKGDINYQTAYNAHRNTSFSPEKRAQTVITDFENQLETVYNEYNKAENKNDVLACFNEYRKATDSLYTKWLGSRSNLASSMIVGPARFPVERMKKLNRYADNHYSRYIEVSNKLINKHKKLLGLIAPSGIIKSGSENALTELQAKLDKLIHQRDLSKQVNKALRSKNPQAELEKLNLKAETIRTLLTPDRHGNKGIPAYRFTNMGAEIRRLQDRIEAEKKLNVKRQDGNDKFTIEGGYILRNYEANRYQILFDEKPSRDMISKLKSHGFKWAPSAKAWQSYLTPNTAYKIKLLFGDVLSQERAVTPSHTITETNATITPNKSVKASLTQAITDLLTLPQYKAIGAMAMGMFYSKLKNMTTNESIEIKEGLESKVFHKLGQQGYVEYNERIDSEATLTDEGKELLTKIEARIDTLKGKKSGSNLFPELAGVTDALFIFFNAVLGFDNQIVSREQLVYIINSLHHAIKSKVIQEKHPLTDIANATQEKLIAIINKLKPHEKFKLVISNKKDIETKILGLQGLGFWNIIASAIVGKTAEHLTHKHLTRNDNPPTLNGTGGFVRADNRDTVKMPGTFKLNGELGKFLGEIQPYKYSIVLTGDTHAGKTEVVMQLANAFADIGKTVGTFMLEQGGLESRDTQEAIDRNIPNSNLPKIFITGEASKGIETVKEYATKFDVIIIDSWQKLKIPSTKFDDLRHEFPNTVFIIIFQQNGEGGTRGGVSADFDSPVHLKVHKVDTTFVNNYVEMKKNRGNSQTLGLKYMVKDKKTLSI